MTIAITAPEKFTFQDLATIDLALRWADAGKAAAVIPEPKGGEDATLAWTEAGRPQTCEVQVKGAATDLGLPDLADYLLHFPDRKASGALLDRLIADPDRTALFVVSGRCEDTTARMIAGLDWTGDPRPAVLKGLGAALAAECRRIGSAALPASATKLVRDRQAHILRLAATPVAALDEALKRVLVQEREVRATLDLRLQARLRRDRVPSDRLADTIARLSDVIRRGKLDQVDVAAGLQAVILEIAPENLTPAKYVDRGAEAGEGDDLACTGVLLLTGPPRIGKTWLALATAGALQRLGFDVRQGPHIDEADRFLTDTVRQDRAYLLEDPLGSRQAERDVSVRIAALRRLVDSLPPGRRLIVTQSEGPLLQGFSAPNLSGCSIGTRPWRRLEPLTVETARRLWRRDAADAGVSEDAIARVEDLIECSPDLRDAGALSYLAVVFDRLAPAPGPEIIRHARSDAIDFARVLAEENPETGAVLKALAVGSEPASDVRLDDLAFLLDGGEDRPSVKTRGMRVIELARSKPPEAPAYRVAPVLAPGGLAAVDILRRRRVIESAKGRGNFVHPYYRAGAQTLVRPEFAEDAEQTGSLVERAIAAADPQLSLCATRNLDWIAGRFEALDGGPDRVFDIAERALGSVFAATRDAAFAFLMTRTAELSPERRARVFEWTEAVDLDLRDVQEVGGMAIVMPSADGLHRLTEAEIAEVQPYVAAIVSGEPVVLGFTTSRTILEAHQQGGMPLPRELVERFLAADEAVLRAAAVESWFRFPQTDDAALLRRVERDLSPVVASALLDALVWGWPVLGVERRESLVGLLERQSGSAGVANVLLQRLSLFGRVEHFGETPPWIVFSRLAGAALPNALRVSFSDGRLVHALDQAIAAGERETLYPFLNALSARLMARLPARLPDENELVVVEHLVELGDPAWRRPLIFALLDQPNTAARIRITELLADRWEALDALERDDLAARLFGSVGDELWLRAAVLTRRRPSADLVRLAAGCGDALSARGEALLDVLGPELYRACLHIHLGSPQPLWWIGGHHSEAEVWRSAVEWSATAASRPLFSDAIRDLLGHGEADAALIGIIAGGDAETLERLFEQFLRDETETVAHGRPKVWTVLLDKGASLGRLDAWFDAMVAAAPSVLSHLRDTRVWPGKGVYGDRLIEALTSDFDAYRWIETIEKMKALWVGPKAENADTDAPDDPDERAILTPLVALLRPLLEQKPPQLSGTWSDVADTARRAGADDALLAWLDERRRATIDRRFDRAATSRPDPSCLTGWVGLKPAPP